MEAYPLGVTPSTTYEWRKTKVLRRDAPAGDRAAGGSSARFIRPRSRMVPIWIEVKFRGGSESSWLLTSRGRTLRVPGYLGLDDIMATINGWQAWKI